MTLDCDHIDIPTTERIEEGSVITISLSGLAFLSLMYTGKCFSSHLRVFGS